MNAAIIYFMSWLWAQAQLNSWRSMDRMTRYDLVASIKKSPTSRSNVSDLTRGYYSLQLERWFELWPLGRGELRWAEQEGVPGRAISDLRNEKINYKVREHSHQKIPLVAVVGRREADERTRSRTGGGNLRPSRNLLLQRKQDHHDFGRRHAGR